MKKLVCHHNGIDITLNRSNESCIDSRIVAEMLDIQHESLIKTLNENQEQLQELGVFRFEIGKPKSKKGGRPEKYALLNEDQFIFAVTLSRNTKRVVQAKLKIVQAFMAMKRLIEAQHDYLNCHHTLHETATQLYKMALQRGSTAPPFAYHANLERLNNKLLGIPKGSRAKLTRQQKNVLTNLLDIEQTAISEAIANGGDDKTAYQMAKQQANDFMRLFGSKQLAQDRH